MMWEGMALCVQAASMLAAGDPGEALTTVERGEKIIDATDTGLFTPYNLAVKSGVLAALDRTKEADCAIAEAKRRIEAGGEIWLRSEVRRVEGEIQMRRPGHDPQRVEDAFLDALAIARAQQAKSWELRAAISLAQLWAGQGERRKAHDLLAPVYAWFTEGFDTPDLKDARALLDELK